jgi:hypothetical protein
LIELSCAQGVSLVGQDGLLVQVGADAVLVVVVPDQMVDSPGSCARVAA